MGILTGIHSAPLDELFCYEKVFMFSVCGSFKEAFNYLVNWLSNDNKCTIGKQILKLFIVLLIS